MMKVRKRSNPVLTACMFLSLLLAVLWMAGCRRDTQESQDNSESPAVQETAQETAEEPVEKGEARITALSRQQRRELRKVYDIEASKNIDAENAEDIASALESEIDKDIEKNN